MTAEDIILVLEKKDNKETNFILKDNDENRDMLRSCGIDMDAIDDKVFNKVGEDYIAKKCSDYKELVDFYYGKYNTVDDYSIFLDKKDKSVFHLLKQLLRPYYEKKNIDAKIGDIIHNTNGCDYKIISILDKRETSMDAVLINVNTFEIVAAHGLQNYDVKYGDIDNHGSLSQSGYEWGHGVYYGTLNVETNMRAIYLENLPEERELPAQDIYEHRSRVMKEYRATERIIEDVRYDAKIREAAVDVMNNKFYGMDYDKFDEALMNGRYDDSFKIDMKSKKEIGGF